MPYAYLLIDLATITIPLAYSFHPKLNFYRYWKAFWIANSISATIFLVWDYYYTDLGVWGFNPDYLTGIYIFNLPIEECLFFICIPYACVFTYHCLNQLIKNDILKPLENLISRLLILSLFVLGTIHTNKLYTGLTFTSLSIFLVIIKYVVKAPWLSRFYFSYIILLLPFFIVNGILTGTGIDNPIVWYDDSQNLGIRLLTIPIEDIFYGSLLILLNVFLFHKFDKSTIEKEENPLQSS